MSNWSITRIDRGYLVEFEVREDDARAISVEARRPDERYGDLGPSQISWPSTSDKRPALAAQLAIALTMATDEARRMDEAAGLATV